jgi:hypothetical protein
VNVPEPESAPRWRTRIGHFDTFDDGDRVGFRPESLWRNVVVVGTVSLSTQRQQVSAFTRMAEKETAG